MIEKQTLYSSAFEYFADMQESIKNAKKEVLIETYILDDILGKSIIDQLKDRKDLRRCILMDGIGSYGLNPKIIKEARESGIEIKYYSPLPWQIKSSTLERFINFFLFLFKFLNRRNHKKIYIIDDMVYTGSFNLDARHFLWRDSGVAIKGPIVSFFKRTFEHACSKKFYIKHSERKEIKESFKHPLVKYKFNLTSRNDYYKLLKEHINNAEEEILITNPYFVPRPTLIKALITAHRRGVKVKLLVPQESDQFYFPIVNATSYYPLLKSGIEVHEYTESILHAKIIIIDNIAIMGSSNLNQRSFYFDRELDVILSDNNILIGLKEQFNKDLSLSEQLTHHSFKEKYIKKIWIFKLFYWLKRFL